MTELSAKDKAFLEAEGYENLKMTAEGGIVGTYPPRRKTPSFREGRMSINLIHAVFLLLNTLSGKPFQPRT